VNRLDSDYPAFVALTSEKDTLIRRAIELEARCNGMVAELTQARLQHEQDCSDIASKHFENLRLRNHQKILETQLTDAKSRITELQDALFLTGAERR